MVFQEQIGVYSDKFGDRDKWRDRQGVQDEAQDRMNTIIKRVEIRNGKNGGRTGILQTNSHHHLTTNHHATLIAHLY